LKFPIFYDDLWDLFGDPREELFKINHLGFISLQEFSHIINHVDDLKLDHARYFGFAGNLLMEGPVKKAMSCIRSEGLGHEITSWECFIEPRPRKNGRGLDPQCWGLALTINENLSDRVVRCFLESGFEWGGRYIPQEPGVFSLAWTREWRSGPGCPTPWGVNHG